MSNVTCTGRESSIDDCFKVLYSLDQAKQFAATTDEVAGVTCVFETVSSVPDGPNSSGNLLLIILIALVGAVLVILLLFGYVKGYVVV